MSTAKPNAKCSLCGKIAVPAHTPFCSQGCRDRDLLNWLGEAYRVPASPLEMDEESTGVDRSPEA
ncbi:MAG: DNA gyrase inhibitor YacG [Sphingomonadaceae bacterium]